MSPISAQLRAYQWAQPTQTPETSILQSTFIPHSSQPPWTWEESPPFGKRGEVEPQERESHRKIWNLSSDYFTPNLSPFGCLHLPAEHQDPVMDFPCPGQDLSQLSGSQGRWGITQLSLLRRSLCFPISELPRSTDSKGICFVPHTFPQASLALLPGRQKDLEHHFQMRYLKASFFYALPLLRTHHSPLLRSKPQASSWTLSPHSSQPQ